jgi:uncharacterized protein (TIGR02757 family)
MRRVKDFLDPLYARFQRPEYLSSDPLEFVHRYADPWDREVVALVAALLAYGNVKQIRRSVSDLLARIEAAEPNGPAAFVRSLGEGQAGRARARRALKGFVHRFNGADDFLTLLSLLARSWREHGSLGAHFLRGLESDAPDIGSALSVLVADWRDWAGAACRRRSMAHLLNAPSEGSCCKRWCMFLRWMGRRDALDPGLWTEASPLAVTFPAGRALRAAQLVIPLDTHTGRISQYLGLTERRTLNWRAALEVTASLRACDAQDPVRYDFALSRLGILDLCQKRFRVEICKNCELVTACRFARGRVSTGA